MNLDPKAIERSMNIALFKFDLAARVKLWRKLGKQLSDGINILVALEELQQTRTKGDPTYLAIGEWASMMKNGRKFWEATQDWVTTEEAMLLMAGDQAGDLVEIRNTRTWDSVKDFIATGEGNVVVRVICAKADPAFDKCVEVKGPKLGKHKGRGPTGTPYPASVKDYGFTFTKRYDQKGDPLR